MDAVAVAVSVVSAVCPYAIEDDYINPKVSAITAEIAIEYTNILLFINFHLLLFYKRIVGHLSKLFIKNHSIYKEIIFSLINSFFNKISHNITPF